MKISVFGLGYVGCVSLGCLAQNGNELIGVDINDYKVQLINSGKPTIIEKDINELISKYYAQGKIRATTNCHDAVSNSQIALICVGTPSLPTGQLNLEYVYNTARQIGKAIKEINWFYVVVIRSTVIPGTNTEVGRIIEESSGKKRNEHFAVISNPEFLREGSAVADYYNPAITVVGTDNAIAEGIMKEIYKPINAPFIKTDIDVAELIKYINNAFHALKVCFANEVGVVAQSLRVDSQKLMELFVMDDRLNISPAYFKPGMAFGGSCLPKDLRGLYTIAYDNYINTPLLKSITESNDNHKNRAYSLVERFQSKKVGVIGLAFKKGTDDLRYSPTVELVEKLLGKGYDVKIYDPNVILSKIIGANKSYIEEKSPHISAMLISDIKEVIDHSETIVLVHRFDEMYIYLDSLRNKSIVDLIGYMELKDSVRYSGIAW